MKVRNIEVAVIKEARLRPRLKDEDPGVAELAKSIRRHGLISPLTVVVDGEGYRLLAGSRRLAALKSIGAKKAPCSVVEPEEVIEDEITMAENLMRRNLSAVEEAYAFALYVDRTGATQEELAERLGKERTYVTRRLMLLDLDDNTLGALEDGILSLSEGLELRRVEDAGVRLRFIEHAAEFGCTHQVMQYWVNGYLRQKEAVAREEGREITPVEVRVPREVLMACDRCGAATSYGELRTVYVCPGCHRRMVKESLVEGGEG